MEALGIFCIHISRNIHHFVLSMSLSKITHLCPLQRLSVLALQVGKLSKLTNRGQVCLENAKEPKAFISALRSLMAAPSGPVISAVNEAGMLSVTGYSCARPRDCDRALHKRLPSTAAAAAAINDITEQPQSELLKLITLVLDTLLKRTRELLLQYLTFSLNLMIYDHHIFRPMH